MWQNHSIFCVYCWLLSQRHIHMHQYSPHYNFVIATSFDGSVYFECVVSVIGLYVYMLQFLFLDIKWHPLIRSYNIVIHSKTNENCMAADWNEMKQNLLCNFFFFISFLLSRALFFRFRSLCLFNSNKWCKSLSVLYHFLNYIVKKRATISNGQSVCSFLNRASSEKSPSIERGKNNAEKNVISPSYSQWSQ